jgi:hypothetical protein
VKSRQSMDHVGMPSLEVARTEARAGRARRNLVGLCGLLLLTLGLVLSFAPEAFAAEEHPLLGTFAAPEFPAGISVDETNGNVFIAQSVEPEPGLEGNSIGIFGPEGGSPAGLTAPFEIGGMTYQSFFAQPVAVDDHPGSPDQGTVYAAQNPVRGLVDAPKLKAFTLGPGGRYELSKLLPSNSQEIRGLAVNPRGELYAGSEANLLVRFNTAGENVERINLAASSSLPAAVAADAQGDIYVMGKFTGSVWKFPANAEGIVTEKSVPKEFVTEGATGIAVDQVTGVVYLAMGNHVAQYSPGGVLETEFGSGSLGETHEITVNSANSKIYVTDYTIEGVAIFGESNPLTGEPTEIGTESARFRGFAAPEGVQLEECFFEYGTTTAYGQKVSCAQTPTQIGAGDDRVAVTAEPLTLSLATNYHYRLVTKREGVTNEGRDEAFKTLSPPVIESVSLKAAAPNEATVGGVINPEGKQTTYFIEYGPTAAYGSTSTVRSIGATKVGESVSAVLASLAASTTYHWRLVATNEIGQAQSADQVFRTPGSAGSTVGCGNQAFRIGPSATLPDCRAYELVSPLDKNNGDIVSLINLNSNPAALDQSALGGERLTYTTSQAFGDAEGAPYVSQYVASRGPAGWTSNNITPPQGVTTVAIGRRVDIEYRAFTPDICTGVLLHYTQPALSPDAGEGTEGLYRKNLCGNGAFEALTNAEVPADAGSPEEFGDFQEPGTKGVSENGACTVFQFNQKIYEGCSGKTRVVSILPDGAAVDGQVGTEEAGIVPRAGNVIGALSADGSRLYWSHEGALYLRVNAEMPQSAVVGGECTEPSLACTVTIPKASESGSNFLIASKSGSVMYFTNEEILYRFDLGTNTSTPIGNDGRNDVLGMSEDGSRIVFPSTEVLIGGSNAEGEAPIAGRANLYLFDATKSGADRYRFIATLSEEDESRQLSTLANQPGNQPQHKVVRLSPDGKHLVFSTPTSLTGYDNKDVVSGQADLEVFAYDAEANGGGGEITCLSCNPTGQPPTGRDVPFEGFEQGDWTAAYVPPGETELYSSEVVSENGNRVFFDSFDALVPGDTNGKEDVYEWEAPGEGSCRLDEGAYSPANGGCLSLISSGESPTDSAYVDSDRSGTNVFFTTASSLLPQDPGLIDIYDARVEGGFPPPPTPAASCEGEACQGPQHPPEDRTPASATYNGPGNVKVAKAKQCKAKPKGKKKNCAATKKKHKKAKHKKKHGKKATKSDKAKSDRRSAR